MAYTKLFNWFVDAIRQPKIIDSRLDAEFDAIETSIGTFRQVLTADTTWTVGSGGDFATIQLAADHVLERIDCAGFTPRISVLDGTYDGVTFDGPALNAGAAGILLFGANLTPANCTISTTSASAITATHNAHVTVAGGFTITVATSGSGLVASEGGLINVTGAMVYGAIASNGMDAIRGTIIITADYTISGGGIGHWHAGVENSSIRVNASITITLSGTPLFSGYFCGVRAGGVVYPDLATFSGLAHANTPKFLVHVNGTLDAQNHDRSFLPGGIAGLVVGTGGVYVATVTGVPIQGSNTNDSAAAGDVGELLSSSVLLGSAEALTTATANSLTTLSLTAGDWDVRATIGFTGNAATTVTILRAMIGTADNTANTTLGFLHNHVNTVGEAMFSQDNVLLPVGPVRVSLASTTTYYLVAQAFFAVNSCSGYGTISARRMR